LKYTPSPKLPIARNEGIAYSNPLARPMRFRRFVVSSAAILLAAGIVFVAGPRVDTTFRPRSIALPEDLDAFVARSERALPNLPAGVEKKIIWARAAHTRTPLAIVYLHGFSATRQETAPLCDRLAAQLGANLYYTRLAGHGLDGAALDRATVDDWLNDATEALAIGQRLGERVILVGTSTGATLAAWLAEQPAAPLRACVLLSPNFLPHDHRAQFLTWPWARQLAPHLFGPQRHRDAASAAEKQFWTADYPTTALIPMMGLVQLVARSPLEQIRAPALLVYSPDDQTVDPRATEAAFARVGSTQKKRVPFEDHASASHHVLAGDIVAPANTARIAEIILRFLAETAAPSPTPAPSA
jgi:esterase/lipase